MTPRALVDALRSRGVHLEAGLGERILVEPAGDVTATEREALRFHRHDVLRHLLEDLELRITAFSAQLAAWRDAGRSGAPTFALPGVVAQAGGCLSCGAVLGRSRPWRCRVCVTAVRTVLEPLTAELRQKLAAQIEPAPHSDPEATR